MSIQTKSFDIVVSVNNPNYLEVLKLKRRCNTAKQALDNFMRVYGPMIVAAIDIDIIWPDGEISAFSYNPKTGLFLKGYMSVEQYSLFPDVPYEDA